MRIVAGRVADHSAAKFLYAESAPRRSRVGRACSVAVVSPDWRGVVGRRRPGCSALRVSHAGRRPDFYQKPGHICRVTCRVAACTTHDFFSVHNGSHVKIPGSDSQCRYQNCWDSGSQERKRVSLHFTCTLQSSYVRAIYSSMA